MTTDTPVDPQASRRDTLGLVLAGLALAVSVVGGCCVGGVAALTGLFAEHGTNREAFLSFLPYLGVLVLAQLCAAAALVLSFRRAHTHLPQARGLAVVALGLTVTAFVVPYVQYRFAMAAEVDAQRARLRVNDVSAIARPCTPAAVLPSGDCPEGYLCIAGAAGGPTLCQIVCQGNEAYCGAGSHCDGEYCVRDR